MQYKISLNCHLIFYVFISVACGSSHTLVVLQSGEVYSCGNNDHGQLGHEKSRTKLRMLIKFHVLKILVLVCLFPTIVDITQIYIFT